MWAGASAEAEWVLSYRQGLARGRHVVYTRMGDMKPACVDTCRGVRHGPGEGMLAGGHMYVDEGRWTCPDLVKLKAGTLELEIKEC